MDSTSHIYEGAFFDYMSEGARRSADTVAAILAPLFADGGSVLDIGCGQGVWTRRLAAIPGVTGAVGVDGDYVERESLAIPAEDFVAHDLTRPLDLGRRFTLALSLEVGEHLPAAAGPVLVDTLVRHADVVMFSAAVPGQGGEFHVNERPLDYWRNEFARHGYVPLDVIRPRLVGRTEVEPWYRYNTLLYVTEAALARLPDGLAGEPVPAGRPLETYASAWWRLRCAMLRPLPRPAIEVLARLKHDWIRRSRRSAA